MLEVNIIFPDGRIAHWEFHGLQPSLRDLREFIKAQYPDSIGAEYIDYWECGEIRILFSPGRSIVKKSTFKKPIDKSRLLWYYIFVNEGNLLINKE